MEELSKETVKAVQEVAKVTGKAVDTINRSADFLHRLIGQSFEDTVGMFVTDPIRAYRINKLIERMAGIQQKMIDKGVVDIRAIAPKIILPMIEGMSLEDDPLIAELWENLMLSAADPKLDPLEKDTLSVLESFTPMDASLFKHLYSDRFKKKNVFNVDDEGFTTEVQTVLRSFLPKELMKNSGYQERNFRNLMRYGLIKSTTFEVQVVTNKFHSDISDLDSFSDTESIELSNDLFEVEFTPFGIDFGVRVIGE